MAAPKTTATPEKKQKVLDMVAAGITVADVCKEIGVSHVTLFNWRKDDREFYDNYWDAKRARCEHDIDLLKRELMQAEEKSHVIRLDKLLNHARWEAEKLLREYTPKSTKDINVSGEVTEKKIEIYWAGSPVVESQSPNPRVRASSATPDAPDAQVIEHVASATKDA